MTSGQEDFGPSATAWIRNFSRSPTCPFHGSTSLFTANIVNIGVDCAGALTGNGAITTQDLTSFLGVFGTSCE